MRNGVAGSGGQALVAGDAGQRIPEAPELVLHLSLVPREQKIAALTVSTTDSPI